MQLYQARNTGSFSIILIYVCYELSNSNPSKKNISTKIQVFVWAEARQLCFGPPPSQSPHLTLPLSIHLFFNSIFQMDKVELESAAVSAS